MSDGVDKKWGHNLETLWNMHVSLKNNLALIWDIIVTFDKNKVSFIIKKIIFVHVIAYEWLNPSLWTHCFRCSEKTISVIDFT